MPSLAVVVWKTRLVRQRQQKKRALLPTTHIFLCSLLHVNKRKHLQITMYNDEKLFAAVERL
jgi:hypothetical protein